MFAPDRKHSQSKERSKKKVPKELLAAFKNTQKLPPPPYGRFPEAGYPMPMDPHLHEVQRRAAVNRPEGRPEEKGKAPQIKVTAPSTDDIMEDDIDKIAFEKKSIPQREADPKPAPPKPAEEPKKAELPHIQEKEVQNTHNYLVQSIYYPEGTKPPTKEAASRPPPQKVSREDILIERMYHTDRKRAGGYARDPYRDAHDYSRSRSPEFYDPRYAEADWGQGYPISKEQLYREFAQRHRTNTLPSFHPAEEKAHYPKPAQRTAQKAPLKQLYHVDFNEDLIHPETTKADRIVINRGYDDRPRKELKNITNNRSVYPEMGSATKGGHYPTSRYGDIYGKGLSGLYPGERRYRDAPLYRDLYETARNLHHFGYSSSYLDLGFRDPYRQYGRLY